MMYYTTIPLVSERQHNRRWDASKLRELRKRLDSGTMTTEEVDQVAADFMDGEIVDLASDWLGNTVRSPGHHRLAVITNFDVRLAGRSEVVRKVLRWTQARDARAYLPQLGHDWYPQEWNLGGAEDHRLCSNA